jgi:antitoxin MazE
MLTKVQKWGNSIALRIPKAFADEMKMTPGSAVEMCIEGDKLTIKTASGPDYTLEELLAGITPENLHKEIDLAKGIAAALVGFRR